VAGFSARYGSANCGWVAMGEETLLIDLPRGIPVPEFLKLVAETTGKPVRSLVLTQARRGDGAIVQALRDRGVERLLASPATHRGLSVEPGFVDERAPTVLTKPTPIGDASVAVEFRPMDGVAGVTGGVVYLPGRSVLFGGPLVVHGPRAPLPGSDTERWVEALRPLEALAPAHVVPGSGSWGGPEVLSRQRRFLAELRRQVGYQVAQGRAPATLREQVKLPAEFFAWMPYDTPTAEDLDHVYRELSVPVAPFHGREPAAADRRPHALVLFGDQPHEPGHIEDGLRPVFEATGVVPHFTVDVKAVSAPNLAKVRLLVILRDGLQRPEQDHRADFVWMTPEQEHAVAAFVEKGGSFLNLHNAMGLYPSGGPYLDLVGGRYTGHGPLERFRVEVVDADHPITRDVVAFSVPDEQHTPICDENRVHLVLRSRSDDGKTVAAAGWVREPGRGRLCHLAPGHTREALLHPMYQRLLRNAVRWCLRTGDGEASSGGDVR
jgi:type 1 glutamine amidotransferase